MDLVNSGREQAGMPLSRIAIAALIVAHSAASTATVACLLHDPNSVVANKLFSALSTAQTALVWCWIPFGRRWFLLRLFLGAGLIALWGGLSQSLLAETFINFLPNAWLALVASLMISIPLVGLRAWGISLSSENSTRPQVRIGLWHVFVPLMTLFAELLVIRALWEAGFDSYTRCLMYFGWSWLAIWGAFSRFNIWLRVFVLVDVCIVMMFVADHRYVRDVEIQQVIVGIEQLAIVWLTLSMVRLCGTRWNGWPIVNDRISWLVLAHGTTYGVILVLNSGFHYGNLPTPLVFSAAVIVAEMALLAVWGTMGDTALWPLGTAMSLCSSLALGLIPWNAVLGAEVESDTRLIIIGAGILWCYVAIPLVCLRVLGLSIAHSKVGGGRWQFSLARLFVLLTFVSFVMAILVPIVASLGAAEPLIWIVVGLGLVPAVLTIWTVLAQRASLLMAAGAIALATLIVVVGFCMFAASAPYATYAGLFLAVESFVLFGSLWVVRSEGCRWIWRGPATEEAKARLD